MAVTTLVKALELMTLHERTIIQLLNGLGEYRPYKLEEAGRIMRVTRERIRQIEAKALKKLEQLSIKWGVDLVTELHSEGAVSQRCQQHRAKYPTNLPGVSAFTCVGQSEHLWVIQASGPHWKCSWCSRCGCLANFYKTRGGSWRRSGKDGEKIKIPKCHQ